MLVVPVEGDSNVPVANPIIVTLLFFVNDKNEVFNVLFVDVSYANVVDSEVKHQVNVEKFP